MKFRKLFSFLILVFGWYSLSANEKLYPRHEVIEDIDSLVRFIHNVHPDMFFYVDKDDWMRRLDRLKAGLPDSLTRGEINQCVVPLITALGDGHTGASLSFESYRVPLVLHIDKKTRGIIVKQDLTATEENPGIPPGTRIRKINGIRAEKLVDSMLMYRAGELEHYKIACVNSSDGCAQTLAEALQARSYDISYVPDERQVTTSYFGLRRKEWNTLFREKTTSVELPVRTFQLDVNEPEDLAVLTIPDFDKLADFYEPRLDSVFRELQEKKIGYLIIDIRLNGGGGSPYPEELMQYISPVPFRSFDKSEQKYSRRYLQNIKEACEKHNMMTYYEENFAHLPEDTVIVENYTDFTPLRENPLRYQGKTYLLTSNVTFSAANEFAWNFMSFGVGTIVGEETGGASICFGGLFGTRTEYAGISMWASTFRNVHYGATEDDIHGAIPDYDIPAEEALDFALDLIRKEKEKK